MTDALHSSFAPREDPGRSARVDRWILVGLFLAALALRLYRLGTQPFWYDEAQTLLVARSPWADITETGDSYFTLRRADPLLDYKALLKKAADAYADPKDQKNPYVSPVYGDYSKGFPPTLIQGGTKEIFLSDFVREYRAIDSAGGTAVLDIYEGMPHVFQGIVFGTPETEQSMVKMKKFLALYMGK